MPQSTVLRIGGVPEHFNLPWHLGIKNNKFAEQDINLFWVDYPSGTGAMMSDLQDDNLDVAIALTEGTVAHLVNHQTGKLLQFYVTSPLIWGIHVAADSPLKEATELKQKRYAISRIGSGSHLMSFVNAKKEGWDPNELKLITVGNIDGARKALAQGEADVFMWEKFMTKPYVDNGEFRRVGECPTPWPCFVIVASEKALETKGEALEKLLPIINYGCRAFMADEQAAEKVAERYHLQLADAKAWFEQTIWATNSHILQDVLKSVIDTLYELGTISTKPDPQDLCSEYCVLN